MSADIIPLPSSPGSQPPNITPMPSPPSSAGGEALSNLLKNPMVLAGGALLAGVALTRLFAAPSVRKLAQDLAQEALKRAKTDSAEPPSVPSLLEQGIEALRPQVIEAAKNFLTSILNKPVPGRRD
jgi:hypothetical protein